jgi:hypothetical protein
VRYAALVVLAACSRGPTCDDLYGVWRSESGERWMVLDDRKTLEAYPLFTDARGSGEIAPRVIDLERRKDGLAGTQHRRYMRGADSCDDRVPVHVTACAGDTLDIVLADSVAPLSYAPCTWPSRAPSRRERWHRE